MSDSYPTIQDSLSAVQKDFMGCVEMHLDPPEDDSLTYEVEALLRCQDDSAGELPGASIRFSLEVFEDETEDLAGRRHAIEFLDAGNDRANGWIRHSMKRVEAQSGRYFWTQSQFEVAAPGMPSGQARHAEVEREVQALVDRIRTLDRSRRLVAV